MLTQTEKHILAMQGNQYALKFSDPKDRQAVYRSYCDHLAEGKSKRSWTFEKNGTSLTWETMEKLIKEYPEEFDISHKRFATAKGYARWEKIITESATGLNPKANTATLQMIMRNKYGWDKAGIDLEIDLDTINASPYAALMQQISNVQSSILKTAENKNKSDKKSACVTNENSAA
jgi:hypothetical protein